MCLVCLCLVLPPVQVGWSRGEKVSATIPLQWLILLHGAGLPQRRHLKMYLAVSLLMETRGMLSGQLRAFHLLKYTQLINSPFIILVG